jgi:hypothetical protein
MPSNLLKFPESSSINYFCDSPLNELALSSPSAVMLRLKKTGLPGLLPAAAETAVLVLCHSRYT